MVFKYWSDSEFETPSVTSEVAPKKKRGSTSTGGKATSKRKSSEVKQRSQTSKPRASSPAPYDFPTFNKVNKKRDLFHILQSEEVASSGPRAEGAATSSFRSRVSTGTSRRTAPATGPFFVDLKVYKTADYNNQPVNVRYKTALVSVKLQCDDSSPPWEALQRFLSQAWTVFEDSEPVHYSDKISFK